MYGHLLRSPINKPLCATLVLIALNWATGCEWLAGIEDLHPKPTTPQQTHAPHAIASGQLCPRYLVVNETGVYWTNKGVGGSECIESNTGGAGGSGTGTNGSAGSNNSGGGSTNSGGQGNLGGMAGQGGSAGMAGTGSGGGAGGSGPCPGELKWMPHDGTGGAGEVLVDDLCEPGDIAYDENYIYWAEVTGGRLVRVTKTGDGEHAFIDDQKQTVIAVAVSDTGVYVAGTSKDTFCGWLGRYDKSGTITYSYPFDLFTPQRITVHDGLLYWTEDLPPGFQPPCSDGKPGSVRKADLQTSKPSDLAVFEKGSPASITHDEQYVYWTDRTGHIMRYKIDGTREDLDVTSVEGTPIDIAVDSSHVYWTNFASTGWAGSVMKMPRDLSSEPIIIAENQVFPMGIALDDNYVYWANAGSGEIMRMHK